MKRTQIANYEKKGIKLTFVSVFDPRTMKPFSFDYSRSDNGMSAMSSLDPIRSFIVILTQPARNLRKTR